MTEKVTALKEQSTLWIGKNHNALSIIRHGLVKETLAAVSEVITAILGAASV